MESPEVWEFGSRCYGMIQTFLSTVIIANVIISPRILPSGKSHFPRKSRPQFPDAI
jgi:hypothetical protein